MDKDILRDDVEVRAICSKEEVQEVVYWVDFRENEDRDSIYKAENVRKKNFLNDIRQQILEHFSIIRKIMTKFYFTPTSRSGIARNISFGSMDLLLSSLPNQ